MGNPRQLKYVARFSLIYVQSDTSDWYISERSAWYFEEMRVCMQQKCGNSGKRQKNVIFGITSKFCIRYVISYGNNEF